MIVGIHWIADDGTEGEPLLFQSVSVRDGRISHIQDHDTKKRALQQRRP